MNAIWKCPLCGKTLIEKNLPPFKIYKRSYTEEKGNTLYDGHTERSKRCDRHKVATYMNLSSE